MLAENSVHSRRIVPSGRFLSILGFILSVPVALLLLNWANTARKLSGLIHLM